MLKKDKQSEGKRLNKLGLLSKISPKPVDVDQPVVNVSTMGGKLYPLLFESSRSEINIGEWIRDNKDNINEQLYKYGAILFRGFDLSNAESFEHFLNALGASPIKYTQRSSPRHEVRNSIYTSTDHPADQYINMHNELSYAKEWPLKIVFFCLQPAEVNGETPIADSRRILAKLKNDTINKFIEKGVLYVRNIGVGLGMGWKDVFQVETKKEVEAICEMENFKFQWISDEHIRIEFIRPAIRKHPVTNEQSWFNHAFFFNLFSLEKSLQEVLINSDDTNNIPFFSCYGDGTPIEKDVVQEIKAAYESEKVVFGWQKGDVLLIDNMLMAHGRNPFEGERKVLVGMLEPHR